MLHDTIPIDFPEFVPALSPRYHRQMICHAGTYAAGLIVTTTAAEGDIRRALLAEGFADIPAVAVPLPPAPHFLAARPGAGWDQSEPYFVICGSIEPRKNHMLLFNVWRELFRRHGRRTPKLMIVGSRWSKHSDALDFITKSTALAPYIVHVDRLSTGALARLVAGACALLMPSFAEGFGLPIVEALAAGTPVIASNIAAHTEAGGSLPTYVSPIDGLGWIAAIEEHLEHHARFRARLSGHQPLTWPVYFERITEFLRALSGIMRSDTGRSGAMPVSDHPVLAPASHRTSSALDAT
jgi:glycosyltransferase involved in cell wall biosynthesis